MCYNKVTRYTTKMSMFRNIAFTTITRSASLIRLRASLSTATNVLDSQLPDVVIPKISIPELIYETCRKFESCTAIECGITGRKYTYGEVMKKSRILGNSFKKLGLNEGNVVSLLISNVPEFPIITLGALSAGLIVTTINPLYTPEEIKKQLADSSSKAVITLVDSWKTAMESCKQLKKELPIIAIKTEQCQSIPSKAINFNELIDGTISYEHFKQIDPENVAFLPYSSGTTGLPKGVELTHQNFVANISQQNSPDIPIIQSTTTTHQDIIPVVMPMFHIYGISLTISAFINGAKLITLSKFTKEDYLLMLRKYKSDILFLAPPIALFLSGNSMVKREDLQSVRTVFCGAAPLGALDEEKLIEKAGKDLHILQGYGLTEASPSVAVTSVKLKADTNVSGSIGRPIPNTLVKVIAVDEPAGTPLGPNCKGELLVKGPQIMKGYLNKPEETKNVFLDGWLRTGDMAFLELRLFTNYAVRPDPSPTLSEPSPTEPETAQSWYRPNPRLRGIRTARPARPAM